MSNPQGVQHCELASEISYLWWVEVSLLLLHHKRLNCARLQLRCTTSVDIVFCLCPGRALLPASTKAVVRKLVDCPELTFGDATSSSKLPLVLSFSWSCDWPMVSVRGRNVRLLLLLFRFYCLQMELTPLLQYSTPWLGTTIVIPLLLCTCTDP